MWKTSALISLMFIIGALLDIYMGKDIKYNCKELPGVNKDKIIITPLWLSFEVTNALVEVIHLLNNKKIF